MKNAIDPDMFRDWVRRATTDELDEFVYYIEEIILELEQDDFFGTEGFNKRFA